MTTVGHTLAGFSLATLTAPRHARYRHHVALWLVFGGLANIPDMPLPHWGHMRYAVSHSIFINAAFVGLAVLAVYAFPPLRRRVGRWPFVSGAAASWLSHMLLDSFYSHGRGIAIYWPLSRAHLALPLPWFDTLTAPWDRHHNLRVFALELLCYGGLLAGCLAMRCVWVRRAASNIEP